jgi:hypothetical protein
MMCSTYSSFLNNFLLILFALIDAGDKSENTFVNKCTTVVAAPMHFIHLLFFTLCYWIPSSWPLRLGWDIFYVSRTSPEPSLYIFNSCLYSVGLKPYVRVCTIFLCLTNFGNLP